MAYANDPQENNRLENFSNQPSSQNVLHLLATRHLENTVLGKECFMADLFVSKMA